MTLVIQGSITWLAQRVGLEGLEQARRFAQALSFEVLASTDQLVMVKGAQGEIIEFCGPDHPVPHHLFAEQDTVVGFSVDQLEPAALELQRAGFTPCTDAIQGEGVRFQHFYGIEGRVFGLIEVAASEG